MLEFHFNKVAGFSVYHIEHLWLSNKTDYTTYPRKLVRLVTKYLKQMRSLELSSAVLLTAATLRKTTK